MNPNRTSRQRVMAAPTMLHSSEEYYTVVNNSTYEGVSVTATYEFEIHKTAGNRA